MVEITECKVEILNWFDLIDDEHAAYIENSIHDIRNNIVILMGMSTGTEQGLHLSYIEVDLLNLGDYIEDNINWCESWCLRCLLKTAARMIEKTLFKISMNLDIECMLTCIHIVLECAIYKVGCLLNNEIITEDIANYLFDGINQALSDLELVQDSI